MSVRCKRSGAAACDRFRYAVLSVFCIFTQGVPGALAERLLTIAGNFNTDDSLLGLSAALDTVYTFEPLQQMNHLRPIRACRPPGAGKTVMAASLRRARGWRVKRSDLSRPIRQGWRRRTVAGFCPYLKSSLVAVDDAQALRDAIEVQKCHDIVWSIWREAIRSRIQR